MKIRQVETGLFHADGEADRQTDRETDMTKLIVVLCNFSNAPENVKFVHCSILQRLKFQNIFFRHLLLFS
jgi:hypothetical protein